jgi:hypothetical protein
MSNRLDALRAASELVSVIGSLVFLRQSEKGVSVSHFAIGVLVGFCNRIFMTKYIGRFRDNPVRYLAFMVCGTALAVLGIRPLDTESIQSLSAGSSLGSFLYRFV